MRDESTTSLSPLAIRNGVLVLSGYGIRVAVKRKHLVVSDGICDERRQGRFSKAVNRIRRLMVLGHTGTISLEGLRWIHDSGGAFIQIDGDGRVIAATAPAGHPGAHLLRAQALAAANGKGLEIIRDLLREKLRGQATVLHRLGGAESGVEKITRGLEMLNDAKSLNRLRTVEAEASIAYWNAWKNLPVHFARRDEMRVPDHWRAFGLRHSPLTASPRNAINPANALLNYLYAMLECEARIAVRAVGLDPALGLLHADMQYRDSLACDLMEPVRPRVDAFALDMVRIRTFRADDFVETRQGVCRVSASIAQSLAETAPTWAHAVAPIAERIAQNLLPGKMKRHPRSQATPLTQLNRSAGRNRMRRRLRRVAPSRLPALSRACRDCGVILEGRRRQYCDDCFPEYRKGMVAAWAETGLKTLAQRRAAGWDPAHGGYAGYKRGKKNAEHRRVSIEWERQREDGSSDQDYRENILPRIRSVPLREIARATGFSIAYSSFIRRGLRVPHPRHWSALRRVSAPSEMGKED